MSREGMSLQAAIKACLSPLSGELTYGALRLRCAERLERPLGEPEFQAGLSELVDMGVVTERYVSKRASYRWVGMSDVQLTPEPSTRDRIEGLIRRSPFLTVKQMGAELGICTATVNYHLKTLRPLRDQERAKLDAAREKVTAVPSVRARVGNLKEKVATLERLASAIEGPVGAMLMEVRSDLEGINAWIKPTREAGSA